MWKGRKLTAQDIVTAYKNHEYTLKESDAAHRAERDALNILRDMLKQIADAAKTKDVVGPGQEIFVELDGHHFIHISRAFMDIEKRIIIPVHKLKDVI